MGRVLTNNVSLAYTIETALGVAGTTWFLLEPNAINTFGADITTVTRDPISKNRQRRKGTITDLDSAVEMEEDITLSSFRDFIEGFCFAVGINTDVTQLVTTAAETTTDSYAVSALSAAQADKFEIDTLIWVRGFDTDANDGLKTVDADIVTSATAITVVENLVDETKNARLSFAGHRIATADVVTWDFDGTEQTGTLLLTGIGTELALLGLTLGETVHIGSILNPGETTIVNAFENSAANDVFGYARVKTINANDVVFDKLDPALQFDDLTDPATAVDILFGEFIRNVTVDDSEFLERSFQFEAEYPNLDDPNSEFEYAIGNFCNTAAFSLSLADKATVSFGFIGTDTEPPVIAGSRKTGASAATQPTQTAAFNTSNDVARLRITDVDETGLTTDFKSLTITLSNNVSPEKVIGTLGAKFMNTGNFEVNVEAQLLFSEGLVVNRIRDNTTVTMDFIIRNDDAVIAVDIPSMNLGGGGKEYPVNESVLINTTGEAFQDSLLSTSIGVSIIPVPLP
ncbi:MAG: phage tail tube protein [Nitrospiraceae bacterium]